MNLKLLAYSAAMSLMLAVGCGPSTEQETDIQDSAQVEAAATCNSAQRECLKCDGSGTYCSPIWIGCPRCPDDWPPQVTDQATCATGQRQCPRCDGSGTYCALRCFECADPAAPTGGETVDALATTCRFPERLCFTCDLKSTFCAQFCPSCPAL